MLISIIKDTQVNLNLPISKAKGQCYDRASTMSGVRNGVAAQISKVERRAVYTHCHEYALNLAAGDTKKTSENYEISPRHQL